MIKYIILLLIVVAYSQSKAQDISKLPLNAETFKIWDSFVKEHAPSDSALNVVTHFATRHHLSGRSILAREVYLMYRHLFPELREQIDEQADLLMQVALNQPVTNDLIGYFVKYINLNAPSRDAFVAVQRLSEQFLNRQDWDSTIFIYNTFKPLFPEMQEHINQIIDILQKPEENLIIRNLGANINTRRNEWDPNPTPDGTRLYFSADHRRGGFGGNDVWYSDMKDGIWQKPVNAGRSINGENDETIDNVTVDGNGIMLSGDFQGTYGKFDIYFKEKTSDGWGALHHFPKPINSIYTDEGGNLTADGMAILFTSDRPGGITPFKQFGELYNGSNQGNMDIYVCIREGNSWSEPINLGSTINTPFSERSPFLHPDGKTLYFSSEGHPGLGRLDVFKSVRLSDSWTEWSEPINLGKEINTGGDDWGYKIGISGDSAFFAAYNRLGGYGGWDLYSVNLPCDAKPEKVTVVRGKVLDNQGMPLSAEIKWEDLSTGTIVGRLKSNPLDGTFFITLPKGKLYGYFAEKSGFYPFANHIDLRNDIADDIFEDITLFSADELKQDHKSMVINNIFFDFDEYELKTESFSELKRLAEFINANNIESIVIIGHTDSVGTDEYNEILSKRRADAVKSFLINNDVAPKSIKTIGKGSTIPISKNDNPNSRALNRRVEVLFD